MPRLNKRPSISLLPLRLHEDLKMIGWKLLSKQDLVGWRRIVDRLPSKLMKILFEKEEEMRIKKKKKP